MTEQKQPRRFHPVRSLTRIVIGGVVLGAETLADRLQQWENPGETEATSADSRQQAADSEQPPEIENSQSTTENQKSEIQPPPDPLPEQLPPPVLVQSSSPPPDAVPQIGYALVGLLFDGGETLERWWNLSVRAGKLAARAADPLVKPLAKIPNPVKKPIDNLAGRGQSQVNQWVTRGREETIQGREITQTAVTSTMDETITYMAQNPALEELVQQQSMSLAQQMLEQIRQMSLSADYFVEGVIRYLLHRPPREMLPPPSIEVQTQANWRVRDSQSENTNG